MQEAVVPTDLRWHPNPEVPMTLFSSFNMDVSACILCFHSLLKTMPSDIQMQKHNIKMDKEKVIMINISVNLKHQRSYLFIRIETKVFFQNDSQREKYSILYSLNQNMD